MPERLVTGNLINEAKISQQEKDVAIDGGNLILGDQAPWGGGLTRLFVADQIRGNVLYCVQDADAPWVQQGDTKISIKDGWLDYWALASRYPFSLEIPGVSLADARQSVKSPRGLSYLAGPSTDTTIFAENDNPRVTDLTTEIIAREARWTMLVAETIGDTAGIQKSQEILEYVLSGGTAISDHVLKMANLEGLSKDVTILSFTEMFKDSPVQLVDYLPRECYWVLSPQGRRRRFTGINDVSENETIIPSGKGLPLEIAARGDILGFTGLSYLPKIVELRDQRVPELKIRTMKFTFDWATESDPIDALWDRFSDKRQEKKGVRPDKPFEALSNMKEYWSTRPTTISSQAIGGNINYTCTYNEI